ncbi:hypothetical protein [Moorena sp. SIO4G3]|uniref:hypothetical protein n=1 Tax=Moorena sp. SIO4G3 TaxID=2607821 RepID=UPI00142B7A31|nr:hypothetical protein [Moorena sp. SIO4G3]NEO75584.1 hypothetical protein [Moorena sp. SIO4G3]
MGCIAQGKRQKAKGKRQKAKTERDVPLEPLRERNQINQSQALPTLHQLLL